MEAGMQRRGGKKMKILFGVISNPQEADCVSNEMFSAMQNGNAKKARELSNQLVQMVNQESCVFLTENEWFGALQKLREKKENFQADYVLSREQIAFMYENRVFFPAVLGLLIENVYKHKLHLLELPISEE